MREEFNKLVRNHDCKAFPCHDVEGLFNCKFCYCSLYYYENCGGNPEWKDGRKDCSKCKVVHRGIDGWKFVVQRIYEIEGDNMCEKVYIVFGAGYDTRVFDKVYKDKETAQMRADELNRKIPSYEEARRKIEGSEDDIIDYIEEKAKEVGQDVFCF